ncbi:hypothetical protein GLOIN_2v1700036 [Rhizophagus clarus]|uniref:Uncharacterized protein n=2 Tax=Rhizophagus clarus TaxID=94130 RepID=A0A8H3LZX9_9GLOM|nr:hypothetical protein GLOIN_2v1700036 [Rhizophagus clarus]
MGETPWLGSNMVYSNMSAVKRENYFKETEPDFASRKAQELVLSFKDDKNSGEVQNFWNQQKISDLDNRLEIVSKETKLQMAISDKQQLIPLLSEKDGRKDFDVEVDTFFQSPAEVSTNVLIKRRKTDEDILNETDNEESELASYAHSQELLNEGVQLPASKNEVRGNVSTCKKRAKSTTKTNYSGEKSSSECPSYSNEEDEEITFDFTNLEKDLSRELTNEWVVGTINVSKRFREYQMKALEKAKTEGLKYDDTYEILALSLIMVFHWPCPYPSFTIEEWEEIMSTNPYKIQESPLPQEILLRLREAYNNHFIVACSFNDLYNCIPDIAPQKMTEDEHLQASSPNLPTKIDKSTVTKQRRPRSSGHILKYGYDGLYSSWAFQTTKMVVDKASIPLADFSISHLVALEEHVERITKDFKYRKCRTGSTTPPEQISYMRDEPDSPQIRKLLGYNSLKRIEKNK